MMRLPVVVKKNNKGIITGNFVIMNTENSAVLCYNVKTKSVESTLFSLRSWNKPFSPESLRGFDCRVELKDVLTITLKHHDFICTVEDVSETDTLHVIVRYESCSTNTKIYWEIKADPRDESRIITYEHRYNTADVTEKYYYNKSGDNWHIDHGFKGLNTVK